MTDLLYDLMSLLKQMVSEFAKILWQFVKAWGEENIK